MKAELMELLEGFSKTLTVWKYNSYVFKVRDYFIPYLLENKQGMSVERVFREEFTRMDIVNATVYYVEHNRNVESLSAIHDFLVMLNVLFGYTFEKYPNSNLQQYKSFTVFQNEIIETLESKGRTLKSKEVYPSLDYEKFDFVINYIKTTNVRDCRLKKFKTNAIAIKLLILYGISLDKLSALKVNNYDYKRRAIEISGNDKRDKIYLEIPYSLALEIEEYLESRNAEKSDYLLAKNSNTQIDPSFVKDTLDVIREEYEEIFDKDDGVNQFTVTGIQKFAIVQMILAGMNQAVIKEFTGQGDDILEDCQRQVNVEKKIDINRHINFTMRGIETYDII